MSGINKDRFWTAVEVTAENVSVYYAKLELNNGHTDVNKTNSPDIQMVPGVTIEPGQTGYEWFGNRNLGRVEATLDFKIPNAESPYGFSLYIRSASAKNGNKAQITKQNLGEEYYIVGPEVDNLNGMGATGNVKILVYKK